MKLSTKRNFQFIIRAGGYAILLFMLCATLCSGQYHIVPSILMVAVLFGMADLIKADIDQRNAAMLVYALADAGQPAEQDQEGGQ